MQFFEYPYIMIPILIGCLFVVGGIVIYFSAKGLKTTNYEAGNSFYKLNTLENSYTKAGRLRENRSIMYIGVFLDNYRNLYHEEKTEKVFAAINHVLLSTFLPREKAMISLCGNGSYIAYANLDKEDTLNLVEKFYASLNSCLIEHGALNIVEVRMGVYSILGTDITFDEAINRAKKSYVLAQGDGVPYVEWNASSGKALEKKIQIENNIENEIDTNRFFLVHQPVLDAKTKEIIGTEVLSRWNSHSEGILQPANFMPAVNSVGIQSKFDFYILGKICKWISAEKEQRERYRYAVNFSRVTLSDPECVDKMLGVLDQYGLKPSCLAVEILEDRDVSEEARERMTENLHALKEKGFSIWLDDFGEGSVSFDDLQNLDISILKIDSSVTQNAVTENGYIILQNIIRIAKSIGFKTLCEGVETKEQEHAVIQAGCDLIQGFYYYKPMPTAMVESILWKDETEPKTNL